MTQPLPADSLPKHVAIIMDGNNRYAKRKGLAAGGGHYVGREQLDPIVEHCRRIGIEALTVFAFSSENWQRPAKEVALLMDLLRDTIRDQIPKMKKHDIALRFIGDRARLSSEIQALMQQAEQVTAQNRSMVLTIAISYGGMWDLTQAAKTIAHAVQAGECQIDQIDEALMQKHISLGDLPAVDLLIRTGGENRISNFLLWQAAYAEFYFSATLWPEFDVAAFDQALVSFAQRERRFGLTSEQLCSEY